MSTLVLIFALLLACAATGELAGSLRHTTYDSQQNRSPGLVIGLASVATILAFTTVRIAWTRCRGRRGGVGAMVASGTLTALLVVVTPLVALASGPL